MNIKIKWLRDRLRTQNLQGMIVSNPVNIKYLTEIEAEGVLLITLKENFFITDSRYVEAVNTILTIEDEILVNDKKNLTKDDYAAFFMFCENVGFEENFVTYAEYKVSLSITVTKVQDDNKNNTENVKPEVIKPEVIKPAINIPNNTTDEAEEYTFVSGENQTIDKNNRNKLRLEINANSNSSSIT